ncbi:MAG: ACP S-malonyltransferase [Verrucomicrobia bacterium]|nr:ACP S-malonyltransferase [Verrucomicrobiota bacterium]
MKKIAFLFPGQGSQAPGMGKDFYDSFAIAKETFQEADDLLSYKLSDILFNGPEETLTQTKYSQLAIFVNSIALLRMLQQQVKEIVPFVCAGLSLGEYTALCASGRIEMKDALKLVQTRANWMNDACERVQGTMAAVLGLDAASVEEALKGIPGIWVANYNCPGQIVISGTKEGVEAGSLALKAKGAKRVLPLTVHGAFHSGLMQSAQDGLAPHIAKAPLADSEIHLVMNVPGNFVESLDEIRQNLTRQVTQSVRWDQGIVAIEEKGVDLYLEIGCGKTLSGLNKKIGVKAPTVSLEKVTDLDSVVEIIEGATCNC